MAASTGLSFAPEMLMVIVEVALPHRCCRWCSGTPRDAGANIQRWVARVHIVQHIAVLAVRLNGERAVGAGNSGLSRIRARGRTVEGEHNLHAEVTALLDFKPPSSLVSLSTQLAPPLEASPSLPRRPSRHSAHHRLLGGGILGHSCSDGGAIIGTGDGDCNFTVRVAGREQAVAHVQLIGRASVSGRRRGSRKPSPVPGRSS